MPYFAPCIDETGIHMPTYEERLADLEEAYRNIFGIDAELSESVPDYQLLSVFAKALDDVSALVLQAYNSRNPMYATGNAMDLLLPQYGLTRQPGETDASCRARIRHSLSGRSMGTADALLSAVKNVPVVKDAKLYINESDSTDANGIPAHSVAVVTRGGGTAALAQAIYDKKAPGIGTYGSVTGTAVDAEGNAHPIHFSRFEESEVFVYLFITVLEGGNQDTIRNTVIPAVSDYIDRLGIAVPLNIPQLYGVAYTADPSIADTFIVTDVQVAVPGASSVKRDKVDCAWNEKITADPDGGVDIIFS